MGLLRFAVGACAFRSWHPELKSDPFSLRRRVSPVRGTECDRGTAPPGSGIVPSLRASACARAQKRTAQPSSASTAAPPGVQTGRTIAPSRSITLRDLCQLSGRLHKPGLVPLVRAGLQTRRGCRAWRPSEMETARGRTVTGHAPTRADRHLIRPASGRQAGTSLSAGRYHSQDTRRRGHPLTESRATEHRHQPDNPPRRGPPCLPRPNGSGCSSGN